MEIKKDKINEGGLVEDKINELKGRKIKYLNKEGEGGGKEKDIIRV